MDQFFIAALAGVIGAAVGALVAALVNMVFPSTVALKKEFVSRDDLEPMIIRLHEKIESDRRKTADALQGISLQIGRLEGKIDGIWRAGK